MVQEAKAYLHAALALYYAGKQITEESLKNAVEALGIAADEVKVKMIVASLAEVKLDEVLKQAVVAAPVAAPAAAPAAQPVAEEKKEEKREEEEKKEEEVDVASGLSGLFGF
ncbi:MAG: 50S ribosomal protein P1 [Acidilobaceae archaeon]